MGSQSWKLHGTVHAAHAIRSCACIHTGLCAFMSPVQSLAMGTLVLHTPKIMPLHRTISWKAFSTSICCWLLCSGAGLAGCMLSPLLISLVCTLSSSICLPFSYGSACSGAGLAGCMLSPLLISLVCTLSSSICIPFSYGSACSPLAITLLPCIKPCPTLLCWPIASTGRIACCCRCRCCCCDCCSCLLLLLLCHVTLLLLLQSLLARSSCSSVAVNPSCAQPPANPSCWCDRMLANRRCL